MDTALKACTRCGCVLPRSAFAEHKGRIRSRIRRALRDGGHTGAIRHLDYTVSELMAHLERQFVKGMGWHNMDKWHIDHIVPLSSFTITGPDDPELRRAWALTNLRPLWAKQNLKKSSKVEFLI